MDTPGHAAFSAIRARGARVTDLIVLVVAAGDGVMAQTREAIQLATGNNVPMVVAINKCDQFGPDAIKKAKDSLLREQVLLEEAGGDTQTVCISATNGTGIDGLLEAIGAQAELMDLEVDPTSRVKATVIEARVEKGRGESASVVVSEGTLRVGDILVGDESYIRVRSMRNSEGLSIDSAGPSEPVELTGWKGKPEAGSLLIQVDREQDAVHLVEERHNLRDELEALDAVKLAEAREALDDRLWRLIKQENSDPSISPRTVRSYDEVDSSVENKLPTLRLIIKCDTDGSLQALQKSINELPRSKCRVQIVQSGIGAVTPSDLSNAASTNAVIVAFNVDSPTKWKSLVILKHKIIYRLLDELKDRMVKLIPAVFKETATGQAKILQLFNRDGTFVLGCAITDGTVWRNPQLPNSPPGLPPSESYVQIKRDDRVIFDMLRIKSMRHLKKEIASAGKGMECGILLSEDIDTENLQSGDLLCQIQRTPSFDTIQ